MWRVRPWRRTYLFTAAYAAGPVVILTRWDQPQHMIFER